MKPIQIAVLAGSIALSATAFANTSTPSASTTANNTTGAGGVVLVQRSVYVPVDKQGDVASNDMVVVQRQAFIPADEISQRQSSGSGMSSTSPSQRPSAVFVLVPTDQATNGDAAIANKEGNKEGKEMRVRLLDQVARNSPRCSDLSGQLPEECFAKGGTGASAVGSTQGQSGR